MDYLGKSSMRSAVGLVIQVTSGLKSGSSERKKKRSSKTKSDKNEISF